MKFCTNCGNQLKDDAKFCPKCGQKIVTAAAPAPAPVPVPEPVPAPAPEPEPELVIESIEEPVAEPIPESLAEPVQEPAPAPVWSNAELENILNNIKKNNQQVEAEAQAAAAIENKEYNDAAAVVAAARAKEAARAQAAQPAYQAPQQKPKKKKGGLIALIIIITLIIVLAIGAFVFAKLNPDVVDDVKEKFGITTEADEDYDEDDEDEDDDGEYDEDDEDVGEDEVPAAEAPAATEAAVAAPAAEVPAATEAAVAAQAAETLPAETEPEPVSMELYRASDVNLAGHTCYVVTRDMVSESSNLVQQEAGHDNTGYSAFDGDETTSWQVRTNTSGRGEFVGVDFGTEIPVQMISFKLGNHRNDKYYYENNVPKSLTVTMGDLQLSLDFPLEKTEFVVVLSRPVEVDQIKFTIDDIYKGTKYDDTVVADISIFAQ